MIQTLNLSCTVRFKAIFYKAISNSSLVWIALFNTYYLAT